MTGGGPKAIETHWGGYRFRSRLEARWAIFMHTLGVRFEYEKEGYELPRVRQTMGGEQGTIVRYLPDFWLPDLGCYLEVKGAEPTEEEKEKAYWLAYHEGNPVFMFIGECWLPDSYSEVQPIGWLPLIARYRGPDAEPDETGFDVLDESPFWWAICPWCETPGIAHFGVHRELPCGCDRERNRYGYWRRIGAIHEDRLAQAFLAARKARFEHGERG